MLKTSAFIFIIQSIPRCGYVSKVRIPEQKKRAAFSLQHQPFPSWFLGPRLMQSKQPGVSFSHGSSLKSTTLHKLRRLPFPLHAKTQVNLGKLT